MRVPKVYVVDRTALAAWEAPNSFTLTFDEAARFIHDLQNAMIDQTNLIIGVGIIILNLIPFFTKQKYLKITIPLSLLIGAIKILFM